ncbi:unnamed protein product [Ceutorhynchus assimilis]|uniref:Glucose-methanol-choline oxidoreductase N-terminal domain-containing protein n=1 Tax=Ceutorhynchus assimilis TaxID=467358 RepID=A0A9N9QPU2_9CUCU|nr:unnamed protein product [Ceutorhynchus assimilis]
MWFFRRIIAASIVTACIVLAICTTKISALCSNSTELLANISELVSQSATYQTYVNNNKHFTGLNKTKKPIDFGEFDYIIVGCGTAGGVLANRLTEDKNIEVLCIEAGEATPVLTAILGLSTFFFTTPLNWGYNTTSQTNACLAHKYQQCPYPRGKVVGGSSTINAGVYARGNKEDYNHWASLGNPGWTYEELLPYFKKSESAKFKVDIEPQYHGFNGPQKISVAEDTPELTQLFLDAAKELGAIELDYNGDNQYGTSRIQAYLNENIRSGTSQAYISPALDRLNLHLQLNCLVTKIITKSSRAVGIRFTMNDKLYFAKATKEVIVSAGAINTPQLLMLSGIGPREELKKHGIEPIAILPVGQYLQDHPLFPGMFYRTNQIYYNTSFEQQVNDYCENKRPLTAGWGDQCITYISLENNPQKRPDIELVTVGPPALTPAWGAVLQYNEKYAAAFKILNPLTDFLNALVLLHPESRGEVTLKSKDPFDFPQINPNFYSDERDMDLMYRGIERALSLMHTKAYKNFEAEWLRIAMPGCDEKFKSFSKKWWICAIGHLSVSCFHPIGTARMGPSPNISVVDHELKVHGIGALRVVDASVMPSHISGHPNAAVVMIAEKASDLIKMENLNRKPDYS